MGGTTRKVRTDQNQRTRRRHKRQIKGYGDSTNMHSKVAQKFFESDQKRDALLGPAHQAWMVLSAAVRNRRSAQPSKGAKLIRNAIYVKRREAWYANGGHNGKHAQAA